MPGGDRLAAMLHPGRPDRPLAVLVHGLAGTEDDTYLRSAARALVRRGFPVLRLELRGNLVSRPDSRSHYHLGRSEDLRDALLALPPALTGRGVLLAGWSLGGALVLLLLARHDGAPGMPRILAAAAISAPLDPAAAHAAIDAHPVLGPLLLALYRQEVLAVEAADLTPPLREAAKRAGSLRASGSEVTATRFGFPADGAFAEVHRADRALPAIRVPTLLLAAEDDPIVPIATVDAVDWSACPAVAPLVTTGGGHCGFEDARLVRDNLTDRALAAWFGGAASGAFGGERQDAPATAALLERHAEDAPAP
jgi:predicted alpha/beta-fold hydrolase